MLPLLHHGHGADGADEADDRGGGERPRPEDAGRPEEEQHAGGGEDPDGDAHGGCSWCDEGLTRCTARTPGRTR